MGNRRLLLILVSLAVLILAVLGYQLWTFDHLYPITTESQVQGITLSINNRRDLYDFLNKVHLWQRTNWDSTVVNAAQGKTVKSLKVVFTDKYLWGDKGPEDPKSYSSRLEIVKDQLVVTIQVSTRGSAGNTGFQTEFIRVLTPIDQFSEQDLTNFLSTYKNKSTFFHLNF